MMKVRGIRSLAFREIGHRIWEGDPISFFLGWEKIDSPGWPLRHWIGSQFISQKSKSLLLDLRAID